ncbi:MAG: SIMPL domain-containing protein [Minisyncoccota bacterium]
MHEYFDHEEVKRFFKLAAVAVLLLAVFLAVETLDSFKDLRSPSEVQSTIVVTGEGEAFATPDIANFTYTVSADAETVGEAQTTVTEKTNGILESLKGLGIEESDIRTTDYSVYPKYVYESTICSPGFYCPQGRQVPDGYTVSHSISVKVRNTDDAGEALALVGEKGATNVSSLMFTIDDPDSISNEARTKAVADARAKARVLAESLGVDLGRVVDFNDNTYSPYAYGYRTSNAMGGAEDAAMPAPTIPMGENKVTSNVTITYEIR